MIRVILVAEFFPVTNPKKVSLSQFNTVSYFYGSYVIGRGVIFYER